MTVARPDDREAPVTAGGWLDPAPFLRGFGWPAVDGFSFVRADPADAARLPGDTWGRAEVPASLRLELVGSSDVIELDLETRGPGVPAPYSFATPNAALWRGEHCLDLVEVEGGPPGRRTVRLSAAAGEAGDAGDAGDAGEAGDAGGQPDERTVIYLPETLLPVVRGLRAVGGEVSPAPAQPRWIVYGDSIAEGWSVSQPALAWPAAAARVLGLDVLNLGYAGAARGEIASAEQIATLPPADVLAVSFGTNCWGRVPHSAGLLAETTRAFLCILRQAHPETPLLVVSPAIRPDAEETPNRLGATLADLRRAVEAVATELAAAGDTRLHLLPGLPIIDGGDLVDEVHPGDAGHAKLAAAAVTATRALLAAG